MHVTERQKKMQHHSCKGTFLFNRESDRDLQGNIKQGSGVWSKTLCSRVEDRMAGEHILDILTG